MEQYRQTRTIAPSISFPESHDTVRLCDELNGNVAGLKQRYLFSALFSAGLLMPIGFEFGFRKKLHVADTRPSDWENTRIDLRSFISEVNKLKAQHGLLNEDGPQEIIPNANGNVLVLRKSSTEGDEELLFVLNMDIMQRQYLQLGSIEQLMGIELDAIADLSPETRVEHVPSTISRNLEPGEGIVLIGSRVSVPVR